MRVRSTVSVGWMEVGGARLGSSQWGGRPRRESTSWENSRVRRYLGGIREKKIRKDKEGKVRG